MKKDEAEFLKAIREKGVDETVRDVINRIGINHKRAWYILEKWSGQGIYEYGVALDLGWLTVDRV